MSHLASASKSIFNHGKKLFLFPMLFIFACHNNEVGKLNFSSVMETSLYMNPKQPLIPVAPNYLKSNDSIITFCDNTNGLIRYFNLYNGVYTDSFPFRIYPYDMAISYNIISDDSILVGYNPNYWSFLHDSIILMFNKNKEVISKFNFEGAPVPMTYKNKEMAESDSFYFYVPFKSSPIYIPEKKALFATLKLFSPPYAFKNDLIAAGWASSDTSIKYEILNLPFPRIKNTGNHGFYQTDQIYLMAEPDNHGNILLTNGRSSQIIKYNYRDNTFKSAYPKFLTMDSIYPIDENPTLRESKQYPSFYYYGIKYDPNRNAYWRFAKMPYKEDDPVITKNYPRISAVLMDTAMNKIAEGILPFGLVNPIPYKEGLLVVNMLESNRESRTILNYLKVDVTKMDPVKFKDYIDEERKNQPGTSEKEETAKFLLKATQSKSAERKIFIVPLEMSCYTCLDPLGQFLKENMEDFKKKNIAFLLISSQPKNLDLYISNNGLKSGVGTVFYKKSTFEIYKVLENWINLKYIEIEDSKISKNKNIFPTDFKTIKILIN